MEWKNGTKYEGDFEDDKKHGTGTYIWPNETRYEGAWVDNKRNGFGKLFY